MSLEVLRTRREFVALNRHGARSFQRGLILQTLPNPQNSVRVGFTATKRIGNAVVRNRAKRRMRALWRDILADKNIELAGYDFVLIAKTETTTLPYRKLLESLHRSLHHSLARTHGKSKTKR